MADDEKTKQLPTDDRLDSLISLVQQLVGDLKEVRERINGLEAKLDGLEAKVDARLHDTRPILAGMQIQIEGVENQIEVVQNQIKELREEVQKGFRRFDRLFDHLAGDLGRVRTDVNDLEGRIDNLEDKPS